MQEITVKNIFRTDKYLLEPFCELAQPLTHLYGAGELGLLVQKPKVAIVGARKMTPYGKQVTKQISRDIARAGVIIVSGLARGIDSTAHRAALEVGGKTIAVLPGPIYKVYPAAHARLAEEIVSQGGLLISEYDQIEQPMKYQFIARNRLIAALADIVLITEAGEGSGSLHTAGFALELGKTVAAVPGPIDSPHSKGTNQLIKTGAEPVLSSQDLLDLLGLQSPSKPTYKAENDVEAALLKVLDSQPRTAENLISASRLDATGFNINMTILELKGIVEQTGGNKWRLV